MRWRGVLFGLAVWALLVLTAEAAPKPNPRILANIETQRQSLQTQLGKSLEILAVWCEQNNQAAQAARIRESAAPLSPAEIRAVAMPRTVRPPWPDDFPESDRYRETELRQAQEDYARGVYVLSRQALHAGLISVAYDLVRESALHDPDHPSVRKILGYVRNGDEWVSPFEDKMRRENKVWHKTLGWIPEAHRERYENGERLYLNKWISAEREAEIRSDFRRAWEIKTEHFLVRTNHSQERGVELAVKLERFHTLFYSLMAGFFSTPEQMQLLFDGQAARATISRPYVVHYFKSRDEYIDELKPRTDQPIEITKGIYFPATGIAYFYDDAKVQDDGTLYHEATHLLLSGSRPQKGEIGVNANFWLIEGIACYMESFSFDGANTSVGDPKHQRIWAAQGHLVQDGYYVPFREYSRMGMRSFQLAPEIRKNYSQAAALTHFFMHFDGGRYRDGLIEHLSQIYSTKRAVRESPEMLTEILGIDDGQIDREYVDYLRNLVTQPLP